MRMGPHGHVVLRNPRGTAVRSKGRPAAKVAHFSAPLQGLSRFAEVSDVDPTHASILTNWIVEEDRITVRPGYIKVGQVDTQGPVSTLIPYYGSPQRLAVAAGTWIYTLTGVAMQGGFINDDWAWTSFSNLSSVDYTIMVNGANGVVSWDGGPTFALEAVTAPPAEASWVLPMKFDKVLAHMNRLWFADSQNLAVYYLPIQYKAGELKIVPLNAVFKRGGFIKGIYNWSIDGGIGMDDALAIFTSNGEMAIYSGVDPGSDWKLVGVFRFDAPMSKDSIINFGGDLYVLVSSGLVPMTTLIRAETETLGKSDQNVVKEFEEVSKYTRGNYGWQAMMHHHSNHAICNMPMQDGTYQQMIRKMPNQIWSKWEGVPARCWGWLDSHAYFGSDNGGIYRLGLEYLSDDGAAIEADVRFAWSNFSSVTKKSFKMVRVYSLTDGQPRPFMDLEVDYNNTQPTNQPELTLGPAGGSEWDVTAWDTSDWAASSSPKQNWQGVTGLGRVGAVRVRVSVLGCNYSLTGVDTLYELGGLM